MKHFLYWWLIVCAVGTLSYITHSMGWLVPVYTNDLTYITFLITVVTMLTTLSLGYKFKLPDLKSRVSSCVSIGIKLPSDDLISVIIAKNFSDKQIIVKKKHIDYIIKRIDRSYEKISQFVSIFDKYSLKKGSSFDLKLIKDVLKMI